MVIRTATEEFQTPPRVSFEDAWQFIVKLGLAAHRYGFTAGRLESFLLGLSKKFGYEGAFRSTPSDIVFAGEYAACFVIISPKYQYSSNR
jgi:hypothetical protein